MYVLTCMLMICTNSHVIEECHEIYLCENYDFFRDSFLGAPRFSSSRRKKSVDVLYERGKIIIYFDIYN